MCKPEHGHPAYGLPVFQYPCRCVSRRSFHTSVQSPKLEFARSTGRAKGELNCSTASSLHCLEEGPWTRPNQAGPTRLISNQGIIDTYLSVALLAQFRTAGHLGCLSFSCRPLEPTPSSRSHATDALAAAQPGRPVRRYVCRRNQAASATSCSRCRRRTGQNLRR